MLFKLAEAVVEICGLAELVGTVATVAVAVVLRGASVFGTDGKDTGVTDETVVKADDSDFGSGNGARFGFKSAEEKVVKVVAFVTEVTRSSMKISSPKLSLFKSLKLLDLGKSRIANEDDYL